MSKYDFYCQCVLKKEIGENKYKTDVAWIPEKYARVGEYIKIKQNDGSWEDGWLVEWASTKKEATKVEAAARDFLKQRKVSDV